jgi:hypothetical protein
MLRSANLILASAAVLVPMAHVLELPNKLTLDGPLWVAIQQHLYLAMLRAWLVERDGELADRYR